MAALLFRKAAVTLLVSSLLIGCATPVPLNLSYQSTDSTPDKLANINAPQVSVEVVDRRQSQAVGEIDDGIDKRVFYSVNDVPAMLKGAFETELRNRGFRTGLGGNTIIVRLGTFNVIPGSGLLGGQQTGTIGFEVSVMKRDGTVALKKYFTGQCQRSGLRKASGTLNQAMAAGVENVFDDDEFLAALQK